MNRSSRVASRAEPGHILCSAVAWMYARGHERVSLGDVCADALGEFEMKGVAGVLFCVLPCVVRAFESLLVSICCTVHRGSGEPAGEEGEQPEQPRRSRRSSSRSTAAAAAAAGAPRDPFPPDPADKKKPSGDAVPGGRGGIDLRGGRAGRP
jgi:hypothetical protein